MCMEQGIIASNAYPVAKLPLRYSQVGIPSFFSFPPSLFILPSSLLHSLSPCRPMPSLAPPCVCAVVTYCISNVRDTSRSLERVGHAFSPYAQYPTHLQIIEVFQLDPLVNNERTTPRTSLTLLKFRGYSKQQN